ncbi:hypothetical protein [Aldersonia kunmingensis]|uniref:hypothetical protein n=1 Tax=Aldersonia kunmingensis TaxID=408066 RepID=UPI000833DA61|nr:hypothetical protein [Aldersonia kunmingensis]
MSEESPPDASAQISPAVPDVTCATSTNRAGTLSVRATDQGLPVVIHLDRRELRYGAEALAAEILRLSRTAAVKARAKRRVELAEAGISDEILDRLGLPTRADAVLATNGDTEDPELAPVSWMRHI